MKPCDDVCETKQCESVCETIINFFHNFSQDRREAMPRFVRKPHSCVVQEGNVGNFKCKVLASSPPVITW